MSLSEPLPPAAAPAAPPEPAATGATVSVDRWPSEIPLLCLVAVAALWIWIALAVTIFGIVYAFFIGVFFFFSHVAFVTYVRGSAVKLSERQFPELHARVVELSRRAGLASPPDAYVMQAGGSLNAFATKLFRSRMIVLFTDLLDECGADEKARDMVIGHEIGHIKSKHLDFHGLLLPGLFVPFLGAAYSRARELTCDRWGRALCGDAAGATRGLAVLAAGGRLGPKVDLAAYIDQRRDLDTGWLTIGKWLAPYPPLSKRIEVLRPDIPAPAHASSRGTLRAAAILAGFCILPTLAIGFGMWKAMSIYRQALLGAGGLGASPFAGSDESPRPEMSEGELALAQLTVESDFARFETLFAEEWSEKSTLPADDEEFAALWERRRPGEDFPRDPFTGGAYGYYLDEADSALVYSAGPDGDQATDDDIDLPIAPGSASG